jgi:hypothetical protein
MYMVDDKKEIPREIFGVSEAEERELVKAMEHIQVDYRFSSMTETEFVSKLFPDVKNKDKLKIMYFGRTNWHWGVAFGKQDP